MVVEKSGLNQPYDVMIVGGGILGICCAYYLRQKDPHRKIAILEKGMIGKGVTAYSACLDFPYGKSSYKQRLTARSRQLFHELKARFPFLPLADIPFIGIAANDKIDQIMECITDGSVKKGEPQQFGNYVPASFNIPEEKAFFYNTTGGYAYNDITSLLAMELAKQGVAIYEGTAVTTINAKHSGYQVQTSYGVTFHANVIIDATGPWMHKGISSPYLSAYDLRIKKVVALHISCQPPDNASILYFFDDDAFVLPQSHFSRWLFSYRCEEWDIEIDKGAFNLSQTNVTQAVQILARYNPTFGDHITGGRVFCDLYSPDGDPLVAVVAHNYGVVGAPGGSGFRLAPAMAEEIITKMDL